MEKMEIELKTIAIFNGKEYDLQSLLNYLVNTIHQLEQENKKLKNNKKLLTLTSKSDIFIM